MDISFQASGAGVTAESIGAPPPVCAPKSMPVIDAVGNWACQPEAAAGAGAGAGGSSPLLLLAAAAGAWWYFTKHKSKAAHTAPTVIEGSSIL